MSVALLWNNRHVHGILDDRESAFHVLTWSSLHYTAHSRHANMGLLMHPYDEVKVDWDGNVKGGDSKINMIRELLEVIFHPPTLHNLIDELRILFREWYRELTGDTQTFPLSNESSSQIYAAVEAEHHKCCEAMKAHGAFEYVFRWRLASDNWSEDCVAQENYTCKRKVSHPPTTSYHLSKSRKSNDGSRQ